MEGATVLNTLGALMQHEPEAATGFLMAAVYCRALREDVAPRDIVEGLWKAMPSSEAWPGLREALLEMLDRADDEPGPPTP